MIDTPFFDAHTHHLPQPQTTAIVSCRMNEKTTSSYLQAPFISVSLHPWYLTEENIQSQIDWLVQTIQSDSRVVALGEAGLDKVCETPFDLQIQAFRKAIELSETYHLPLVIHSVKVTAELFALHKEYHPAQAWIIHGFRGKKELATDLLRHGSEKNTRKKHCPSSLQTDYYWKAMKQTQTFRASTGK